MPQTLGVRRKYRIRRFLGSGWAFAVVLVLFLVFAQAGIGMYSKAREAKEKRDLAFAELQRLEARQAELQATIARLSSERGVEEELRNRFFIAKEGEKVAILNTNESEEGRTPIVSSEKSFWKKFLSAVGLFGE
jgi:cell division protein FtsB